MKGLRRDMSISKEQKQAIMQEFGTHPDDTGSAQVQIAILTTRIKQLTEHLNYHKHDEHSRRGLLKLVGQRRRHLRYLARTNPEAYRDILQRLELRR